MTFLRPADLVAEYFLLAQEAAPTKASFLKLPLKVGLLKPALALGATTCFQIATVAGALLVVNDHQRRGQHYRELHRMLTQWDKQLELSQTWPIVLRIISLVEKALLAELIEWRSLIRHRKVPQK